MTGEKDTYLLVRHPKRGKHHVRATANYTYCDTLIRPGWEAEETVKWADEDCCRHCARLFASSDSETSQ